MDEPIFPNSQKLRMSPRQIGHQADVGWRALLSWSANQEFGANAQLPPADSINPQHVTIRRHFPVQFPAVQSFRRCSIHVIMFINSRPDHCKAFVIQIAASRTNANPPFFAGSGLHTMFCSTKNSGPEHSRARSDVCPGHIPFSYIRQYSKMLKSGAGFQPVVNSLIPLTGWKPAPRDPTSDRRLNVDFRN